MHDQVLAVVTVIAGALLALARQWLVTKQFPSRLQSVYHLASIAVSAAEKHGEDLGATSAEKYTIASDMLATAAKRVGIKLKPEEVVGFIHAALREMQAVESQYAPVPLPTVPPAAGSTPTT